LSTSIENNELTLADGLPGGSCHITAGITNCPAARAETDLRFAVTTAAAARQRPRHPVAAHAKHRHPADGIPPGGYTPGGNGWLARADKAMMTKRSGSGFIAFTSIGFSRFQARRQINVVAGNLLALEDRTKWAQDQK
jgi:hypothetical protein